MASERPPRVSTFSGRPVKPLPGQLSLDDLDGENRKESP
jgi:hypothetical protein